MKNQKDGISLIEELYQLSQHLNLGWRRFIGELGVHHQQVSRWQNGSYPTYFLNLLKLVNSHMKHSGDSEMSIYLSNKTKLELFEEFHQFLRDRLEEGVRTRPPDIL